MNSPFALLFLAVQQRMAAIVTGSPATSVFRFIEQDLMQLEDHTGDDRPKNVSWPCGLVDIDDANYENMGENAQTASVKVRIRIGFPPYSSTALSVPPKYRNKALYYYDLEQFVVKAFHGWSPGIVNVDEDTTADLSDIFGHFIRIRAVKEVRDDRIRVRNIIFSVAMNDMSTKNTYTMAPVTPNITDDLLIFPE